MINSVDHSEKRSSTTAADSVVSDEELIGRTSNQKGLQKSYSSLHLYFAGFNLSGIVPSIASVLVFSLPGGGTHGMIWAWFAGGILMTVVSLAIAEHGSIHPFSGGMHRAILTNSTSKHRRLLAWIAGYASAIGNIGYFAAISWACALQIMAAAAIGSGYMFQPTMAATYGVYCGVLILQGAACSMGTRGTVRLQTATFILNISIWIALLVALLVLRSGELNTTKFVFGTFTNANRAWTNNVLAFLLTFISPIWVLGKATNTLYLAEESSDKPVSAPLAIFISTFSNAVMGWGLMIVLAFCMGDNLRGVLFNRSGEPMATILLNAFSTSGMLAAWSFIILLQFKMGTDMLTVASRQIYSFSQDGAFSMGLPSIHGRNGPLAAIWNPIMYSIVGGLLAFAGSNAICRTFFSLAVIGQLSAYTISILSTILGQGNKTPASSTFRLGFMSLPVKLVAIVFMTVISVILLFPDTQNPSGGTMNYSVAILGVTFITSIVEYHRSAEGIRIGVPGSMT